ncbi:Hypothetical protein I5071_880 (plasmid) [Sandaracinus amylolyticus]|nr:Hypothetical protein I5071_880 [Sandaracinus amylolyticus]
MTWGEVAAELNLAAPTVIAMGDNLRRDLPGAAEAYDVVVVDCPGRAGGKRTAGALLVADAVLLPCAPATPDIWALSGSIDAVQEAQAIRPDLRGAIVLNRVDRTAMTKKTRDALSQAGLPVLKASLGARVAFNKTLAAGEGITTYEGGSTAANELRRLVDEVEDLLEMEAVDVA